MNRKEKIIANLSKELNEKKGTRINIRMSDGLYERLTHYKDKSGVSVSDIIRIALMNYFVEEDETNEAND